MLPEQLLPLTLFIIAMVATPGPNNLMLMASGANFGFRRTVPHILGISIGCQLLLLAIALGIGQLFTLYPQALIVLRVLGATFLFYLAWLLVRPARKSLQVGRDAQPLSFWQATLFQWVNPKAWVMGITAVATYSNPAQFTVSAAVIALLFLVLGAPLISAWAYGGSALKFWLQQGRRLVCFNWSMAVLLLASLYPILM
ncbi:MAG: LysE family translocator [Gammaproteobacteria bacterium]|nr:LysE family translocator [Gammaproteobacteria bacterium]MDP2140472.1 LysE family translocator [Gammaproteobacteria bacterium]MDP2349511.1 LysE family translocator [Gammaproteobacteria bacterium]